MEWTLLGLGGGGEIQEMPRSALKLAGGAGLGTKGGGL